MNSRCRTIRYILWMAFLCEAACQSSITSDVCATIGKRFTIQLVSTNPLKITWQLSDKLVGINLFPNGSACRIEDTTVYNLTRYTFTCESNEFIMHIENTSNADLNKSWYITVYGDRQSYFADVRVCVPVSFINMSIPSDDTIDVKEGVPKMFKCETSAAWPQANITWYTRDPNTNNEDIINSVITSAYERNGENLYITHSLLTYNTTRKEQNYGILYKANNTVETSVLSVNQPQLNILYVPNNIIPVIKGHGDSFTLIENSTLNITCAIHGGNPRPKLVWICNDGTVTEENSGTVTKVRVVWRAKRNKDGPCTCISYHPLVSTNQSDTVNIDILYPPAKPALSIDGENRTGTITVINNTVVVVRCFSTGKPPPTFTWQPQNIQNSIDTNSISIDKNTSVSCTASNTMTDATGITTISSDIFLHILYGPTTPILSCSSQNSQGDIIGPTVDVIHGDDITLTCFADAYPEPSYTWNGKDVEIVTIRNVEHDDMMYNCVASNLLKPNVGHQRRYNSSSIVRINILYGPRTPSTLKYILQGGESDILSTPLNVVEYSSFSITCYNSNSKPMSTYQWIGQMTSDNGVLDVTAIKRPKTFGFDGKSYYSFTCMARNTMVNTCGDQRTETGKWNETQRVNVLFSASLDAVHDMTVLEGNTFNLTAHVRYHGSPKETYKWFYKKAQSSSKVELASNLTHTIRNISRISAGFYTIEATNQISPTGLPKYNATVNQTFYLNVFYKTSIALSIDGEEGNATVNENVTVTLLCTVDSNPESDIHLYAITYIGENQIAQSKRSDKLEYKLQNATCYHTGDYFCKGGNNYTSPQAVRRTHLFVRCSPRPRYSAKQNITIYSALGESVTLNMTVIAFPIPSPEQFTWVKLTGQNDHVITSDPNTNLTTVDLDTQLTIKQLNQTDLGQYKLTIEYSDTGNSYNHYFYIAPKYVLTPTNLSSAAIGGVIGGSSALIIIVVVIVLLVRRKQTGKDSEEHGYETTQSRTMSSENENAYNILQTAGQVGSDQTIYYNLDRNPYEDLNRAKGDNHEYGTLNISDDTGCLENSTVVGYGKEAVTLLFQVNIPGIDIVGYVITFKNYLVVSVVYSDGDGILLSTTGVELIADHSSGNLSIRIPSMNITREGMYAMEMSGVGNIACIELYMRARPNQPVIYNTVTDGNVKIPGVEDHYSNVTCTSIGGYPRPNLARFKTSNRTESLVDNSDMTIRSDRTYTLTYTFKPTRTDDGALFICQTSFDRLPFLYMDNKASLYLNLKPLHPRLTITTPLIVTESKTGIATCTSEGFRPKKVVVSWTIDDTSIEAQINGVADNGSFRFSAQYHNRVGRDLNGKELNCLVNHVTLEYPLEVGRKLNVLFQPLDATLTGVTTDVQADHNNSIELNCTSGSSNPQPAVTWFRNSKPTTSNAQVHDSIGEYNGIIVWQSLILHNVHRGMDGEELYCEVRNNVTSQVPTKSNTKKLDLNYHPTLTLSNGENVNEGDPTSFTCEASSKPYPTFTWYHNDAPFNISSVDYGNLSVLTISRVSRIHSGEFRCQAVNGYVPNGMVDTDLIVKYKPDVTVGTKNVTVNDKSTEIICIPSGIPSAYTYSEWKHYWQGQVIVQHQHGLGKVSTLKLSNLTYEYSGVYECRVDNGIQYSLNPNAGQGTAYLEVETFPIIIAPGRKTIYASLNIAIVVPIEFYSNFENNTVQCFRNNRMTDCSTSMTEREIQLPVFGTPITTKGKVANINLTIHDMDQFGIYMIQITNAIGSSEMVEVDVIAKGSPQKPSDVTIENVLPNMVTLSWMPGFHGVFNQTFIIEYSKDDRWLSRDTVEMHGWKLEQRINGTISNLQEQSRYFFRIRSYNERGFSTYSDILNVTTKANQGGVAKTSIDAPIIAGAVTAGCIFVIALSIGASQHSETSRTRREATYTTENSAESSQDYYNIDRNPYEDLRTGNKDVHEYGTLNIFEGSSNQPNADTVYENLKMSRVK